MGTVVRRVHQDATTERDAHVAAAHAAAADRRVDRWHNRERAEEQLANLDAAKTQPHVLDLPTLDRVIRVATEQQGDRWLYQEQLERWGTLALTDARSGSMSRAWSSAWQRWARTSRRCWRWLRGSGRT
jgi:hypothetical protein